MAAIAALVSTLGAVVAFLNTADRLETSIDESLLSTARDLSAAPDRSPDGHEGSRADSPTEFSKECPPTVVRAADRPMRSFEGLGRIEAVDGGHSRDLKCGIFCFLFDNARFDVFVASRGFCRYPNFAIFLTRPRQGCGTVSNCKTIVRGKSANIRGSALISDLLSNNANSTGKPGA